jgi:hypothetical protein
VIDVPRRSLQSRRDSERGTIILLVAVVMLFVVGAMAALSIDVVTLYTARSEAQLVADSTALAFARVIANSGATSDSSGASMATAWTTATNYATQVALKNQIAGISLTSANLTFSPAPTTVAFTPNPQVTVKIQLSTLPTFFARIWGTTSLAVAASATAEVFNPSIYNTSTSSTTRPPVAPLCVKPWLIPNVDPSNTANRIFDTTSGSVQNSSLLGWNSVTSPPPGNPVYLQPDCGGRCSFAALQTPNAWRFYAGDPTTTFQYPSVSLPNCTIPANNEYERSVAGCIQVPVACNQQANIDIADTHRWDSETDNTVNCLIHAENGPDADKIDLTNPAPPFQFTAGSENPAVALGLGLTTGEDVMVSDSLVTVPVYDNNNGFPSNPLSTNNQIVGFVQLFLNPDGGQAPESGVNGQINTTIVNLIGCGSAGATGTPIIGNGATAVAVRLISPSTPSP